MSTNPNRDRVMDALVERCDIARTELATEQAAHAITHAERDAFRDLVGDLLDYTARMGGWVKPEDQMLLARARAYYMERMSK